MPDLFTVAVVILFLLAIVDLAVGVSNDAVNFLNSAIGSRVATRRTILIIASIGIVLGATFSSGMMEVARKGIFNPEMFLFEEIMIIFLAVMITDVLLLDVFNTYGMPTSTTVSIVFELLGAATAIALLKMTAAPDLALDAFINSASALKIISGILLSVGFAFAVGACVMFLSRLLFTYDYQSRLSTLGAIWGGLALTAMTYFILIKGLKGASFASTDSIAWIKDHTLLVMGAALVFWSILMQILMSVARINVLKIVVLAGTFSIALAFAGNDLVNFVGVPLAGLSSYDAWQGSGLAPDALEMGALAEPVRSSTILLLIAGGIMVVALWTSRKARSVTETEVNLGRQDEGVERFRPGFLSRSLVRMARNGGAAISAVTPKSMLNGLERRFQPQRSDGPREIKPAFDMVRASVNLTVASVLIAFATSLKLPLSTTYVTFMVAMGTSLADRAWGRDSAVHRVGGVLSVITGWFLTAAIAFTVAGVVAVLLKQFGGLALGLLMAAVLFALWHSRTVHKRRAQAAALTDATVVDLRDHSVDVVLNHSAKRVAGIFRTIADGLERAVQGLASENRRSLGQLHSRMRVLHDQTQRFRHRLLKDLRELASEDGNSARRLLRLYDLEQDLVQSIDLIVRSCHDHVANSHRNLLPDQVRFLTHASNVIANSLRQAATQLSESARSDRFDGDRVQALLEPLESGLQDQVVGFAERRFSNRNMILITTIVLEAQDLLQTTATLCDLLNPPPGRDPLQPSGSDGWVAESA